MQNSQDSSGSETLVQEKTSDVEEETRFFPVIRIFVAGVAHHQRLHDLGTLAKDERLTLAREPTNEWDKNAVKILRGDRLIGYVPAETSRWVSRILAAGHRMRATVSDVQHFNVAVVLHIEGRK